MVNFLFALSRAQQVSAALDENFDLVPGDLWL